MSILYVCYSTQVHLGAPWPLACLSPQFSIPSPAVRRRVALERHRFTRLEALKAGVVDRLANLTGTGVGNGTKKVLEEAMALAKEVKELTSQNVWGVIKAIEPIVLATAVLGSNSARTDLEMRTVVKEERLNSTWSPHGGDDISRARHQIQANMATMPLKRLHVSRTDIHPQLQLQQHINRGNKRVARMTGRSEPAEHELRAEMHKRMYLLGSGPELRVRSSASIAEGSNFSK
ncbi:hypothetical protein M405DRAFT_885293, partial [Rhizopogon salebrosus TDB-379]